MIGESLLCCCRYFTVANIYSSLVPLLILVFEVIDTLDFAWLVFWNAYCDDEFICDCYLFYLSNICVVFKQLVSQLSVAFQISKIKSVCAEIHLFEVYLFFGNFYWDCLQLQYFVFFCYLDEDDNVDVCAYLVILTSMCCITNFES